MFWLLKKIIFWTVFFFVAMWVLKMPYNGRPVKDYLVEFYNAPIVQEGVRFSKKLVEEQLQKFMREGNEPPMENIQPDEREDLERVIRKESH